MPWTVEPFRMMPGMLWAMPTDVVLAQNLHPDSWSYGPIDYQLIMATGHCMQLS